MVGRSKGINVGFRLVEVGGMKVASFLAKLFNSVSDFGDMGGDRMDRVLERDLGLGPDGDVDISLPACLLDLLPELDALADLVVRPKSKASLFISFIPFMLPSLQLCPWGSITRFGYIFSKYSLNASGSLVFKAKISGGMARVLNSIVVFAAALL